VIVRTTTQASSQLSSAELFPILPQAKFAEVAQLKFMMVSDKHWKMRFYYDMHGRRERLGPSVRVALLTKLSCHRSLLYSSPQQHCTVSVCTDDQNSTPSIAESWHIIGTTLYHSVAHSCTYHANSYVPAKASASTLGFSDEEGLAYSSTVEHSDAHFQTKSSQDRPPYSICNIDMAYRIWFYYWVHRVVVVVATSEARWAPRFICK
jgi:hypothetical protein